MDENTSTYQQAQCQSSTCWHVLSFLSTHGDNTSGDLRLECCLDGIRHNMWLPHESGYHISVCFEAVQRARIVDQIPIEILKSAGLGKLLDDIRYNVSGYLRLAAKSNSCAIHFHAGRCQRVVVVTRFIISEVPARLTGDHRIKNDAHVLGRLEHRKAETMHVHAGATFAVLEEVVVDVLGVMWSDLAVHVVPLATEISDSLDGFTIGDMAYLDDRVWHFPQQVFNIALHGNLLPFQDWDAAPERCELSFTVY